jgi:integrase
MPATRPLYNPILKKGTTWCIEYYIELQGVRKRIRRSKDEQGRELNSIIDINEREAAAQQMLATIRAKITQPEISPEQTEFIGALAIAVELKRSNKFKTNKTFAETARWVSEFFIARGWQNIRCAAVTVDHIQAYFDHCLIKRKIRNTTYNTRKNNLRALLTELVKRKYIPVNFATQISNRPAADPIRRSLSDHEYQVIMQHFEQHDRAMLLAAVLLGVLAIRPGELRDLKCGAFDWARGVVRFSGDTSKNNRVSVVTIPDDAIDLLRSYSLDAYPDHFYVFGRAKGRHNVDLKPGAEPIGMNTLSNRFRTALAILKRAGKLGDLSGVQFYSLKDSLAIYMLDSGIDVETAMRHFRQRNLDTFQRYAKRLGVVSDKVKGMSLNGRLPGRKK